MVLVAVKLRIVRIIVFSNNLIGEGNVCIKTVVTQQTAFVRQLYGFFALGYLIGIFVQIQNLRFFTAVFKDETLNTVRDTMAMVFEAQAQGFVMPPEYEGTYQQVLVNFAGAATEGGYADLDAYLQASYGEDADRDSFESYLHQTHLAAAYADRLLEEALPTDEEARAYFAERKEEYTGLYDIDPDDEATWLEQVRSDLQQETYQNAVLTIRSKYSFLVNTDHAVLTPPKGLYES